MCMLVGNIVILALGFPTLARRGAHLTNMAERFAAFEHSLPDSEQADYLQQTKMALAYTRSATGLFGSCYNIVFIMTMVCGFGLFVVLRMGEQHYKR